LCQFAYWEFDRALGTARILQVSWAAFPVISFQREFPFSTPVTLRSIRLTRTDCNCQSGSGRFVSPVTALRASSRLSGATNSRFPDDKYLNMRAYMWGECKEWLLQGGIPNDAKLAFDLGAPGYSHDRNVKLVLEKKEDIKKRLKRFAFSCNWCWST
jgi:hypothetical protein